ncbi:MAG: TonB-dependent receptor [Bacteroidetes bacterium]|nr:TonB-dependent receptor [Bacteroidota bacterium]
METIIRNIAAILFFSSLSTLLYGGEPDKPGGPGGQINGKIVESSTGIPLEYANVVLLSNIDSSIVVGAVSGADGAFSLPNVSNGEYHIEVYFLGFHKTRLNDIVISKTNKVVELGVVQLSPASQALHDVEVKAEKLLVETKIDKKIVNIDKDLAASGSSAAEALRSVPSITVDIEGNVALRGSQSYTVLVDGKPQQMGGPEILKQIPASIIERIEVITNPSAKYDPNGASGIIHIITKKTTSNRTSGYFAGTAGSGDKYGANGAIQTGYGKLKWKISGRFDDQTNTAVSKMYQELPRDSGASYLVAATDRTRRTNPWAVNSSLQFLPGKNNTFSLDAEYGFWGMKRNYISDFTTWSDGSKPDYSRTNEEFYIGGIYYNATLAWEHKFAKEGHQFTASVMAGPWLGTEEGTSTDELTDIYGNSLGVVVGGTHRTDAGTNNYYLAKFDYTLPFGKQNTLEAGFQSEFKPITGELVAEEYNSENNAWTVNPFFSNNLLYHRNIHSGYAEASGKTKYFDWKGGIRLEYTDRLVDPGNNTGSYKMYRWDYFPSIFLMKEITPRQTLQFSASKRINRPQEWFLVPNPIYSDKFVYIIGNPALKPENSINSELNYMIRVKPGMISAGAFYRQVYDAMIKTIGATTDNIVVVSFDNLATNRAAGFEAMTRLELSKWLTMTLNGSAFFVKNEGQTAQSYIDQEGFSWQANSSFAIKAGKNTRFQIDAGYNGPGFHDGGEIDGFWMTGVSVRRDFLKNKLTATLNVIDVLGTVKYNTYSESDVNRMWFTYDGESPVVKISLSYRFNNYRKSRMEERLGTGAGGGGGGGY